MEVITLNKTFKIIVSICLILVTGTVMYMGIEHAVTVVQGTKADPTTAIAFTWKDTPSQVLNKGNQDANIDWTTLDLTAYTSTTAKMVYLRMYICYPHSAGTYTLNVRKNGTTTIEDTSPGLRVNRFECVTEGEIYFYDCIVGMDTNQIIEYKIGVSIVAHANFVINVLGYWE